MHHGGICIHGPRFYQVLNNCFVCLLVIHSPVLTRLFGKVTLVVHRIQYRQLVLHADHKVLLAVARCGMDTAGTLLQRDVVPQYYYRIPVNKRVLAFYTLKLPAGEFGQYLVFVIASQLPYLVGLVLCHHEVGISHLNKDVFQLRIQGYGQVCRQCPGRRGPNNHVNPVKASGMLDKQTPVIPDREIDVYRMGLMVAVFNLRLGQRRFTVGTPVDRLEPLVDVSLFGHLAEYFYLLGFKLWCKRQVRIFPVSPDAKPFKLLPLQVHVLKREFLAKSTELGYRFFVPVYAQFLYCLRFNGQTMGVPTRYIGRIVSIHGFGFHNNILEYLVQGLAQVNVTIGVGRAVMKYELLFPRMFFKIPSVYVFPVPEFNHFRFLCRKICPHRKVCLWQV